jgi:hypothetical protein
MSSERTFPPYRPGQRRAAPDPQTRRILFVASIIGTVLVGGVAGTLLFGGQGKTRVPVVEASDRPIRVRPDDPGGMQVSGLSESAFDGTDSDWDAPVVFAPATEEPSLAALEAQRDVQPDDGTAPSAQVDPTADQQGKAPPAPLSGPVIQEPVNPVPARTAQVQLAALGSQAAARAEWTRLRLGLPQVLRDRRPLIQAVRQGSRMSWRLRVGGFSTSTEAIQFCDRVRSAGFACMLAEF